ncbi:MAG: hypothetical protein HZB38_08325 [Planctomycetes bacterium]|nr:hypothetical protein [Planctomycetota bacterium]
MANLRIGRSLRTITLACAGVLALIVGGCATMQSNSQAPCPQNSNAELMDYISDQPFVTAEAGYRATYVLWKGQPFEGDFAALAAELGQARIAPDWA